MNEPTVVSYVQRLHEIFDRVVDLPAVEREAEIAGLAADDPKLAEDLRSLLEHADRTESPLDDAAMRLPGDSESPLPQIPGFRVHRRIGRGGSATVYLADQEHTDFTRQVALKVVDRLLDDGVLRSVRKEQRILARLEHPGIARLYDSGMTPWGQHWLAMEHVEGTSIVDHSRARHLTPRERIELFLSVLDAVAYAHARGIVHRDLKPANIFVTAGGETRLLDFGIAKVSEQDETRTLQRALTPAYASPEQVRGDRTTTASDIYSLGVVLHELLMGTLPDRDLTEPLVTGGNDIDAVLHKALRHHPEERYASVSAMADDLRRVLAGERVAARHRDLTYLARKILRRHRLAIAVTIVVLLLAAAWPFAKRWKDARPTNEVAIYHDVDADSTTRRWLRDGAGRLAKLDGIGARDSFRSAAESSKGNLPGEVLAWDGVARAEGSLGEPGRADEAARRAGALLAGRTDVLPKHEAERVRARALAANREWNAAIAALDVLFGEQPERMDVGLDLVRALLACGRTDAADTALGRLRQIAAAGDPRIDLLDAEVAMQMSEFQRAAAAASRARDRAASVQAVALAQRAARVRAEAIGRLDRREEARRELASILARNQALGLTGEAAAARFTLGLMMMRAVDSDETRRTFQAALTECAQTGYRRYEIMARTLLAMLDGGEGKLAESIRTVNAAVGDARAIGDRWCEGYVLSQLRVLYSWSDDAAAREAMKEPLLAALRESGNRLVLLVNLVNLSFSEIDALNLEKGEAYIAEAERLARHVGTQLNNASIDRARGHLEETRGNLDLARKSYTAGVERGRQAKVAWDVGNQLNDLALLELEADRPGPAAEHARQAIEALTSVGDTVTTKTAEGVLAWSEARLGNVADAQRRLAALRKAAADDGSDVARFTLLGIEAHVAAASGDWRRAIELRRETVRIATEWNVRAVVIKHQVFLAEALRGAGERRALEKLVAEMLPEVERHGLRGIERKLRALLASPA